MSDYMEPGAEDSLKEELIKVQKSIASRLEKSEYLMDFTTLSRLVRKSYFIEGKLSAFRDANYMPGYPQLAELTGIDYKINMISSLSPKLSQDKKSWASLGAEASHIFHDGYYRVIASIIRRLQDDLTDYIEATDEYNRGL